MFPIATNILAFLFVLGVLIFVHEFGHFFAARRLGIGVKIFSLGVGPRLFGFRRGETDYRVSALPFGGYCLMKGEHPDDQLSGQDDEYLSRSKGGRTLVLIMGPAMNILLAVVILSGVFITGITQPAYFEEPALVGYVEPNSPVSEVDIQPGDLIVEFDGSTIRTWEELQNITFINPDQEITFTIQRESETLTRQVRASTAEILKRHEVGYTGIQPPIPLIIDQVREGYPAAEAGLQSGDQILRVNGLAILNFNAAFEQIQENVGTPLTIQAQRDNKRVQVEVTPVPDRERGFVGVVLDPTVDEIVIQQVMDGYPAADAGLQAGDRIISINNEEVGQTRGRQIFRDSTGETLELRIFRPTNLTPTEERGLWRNLLNLVRRSAPQGEQLTISLTPAVNRTLGIIGIERIRPPATVIRRYGPVGAIRASLVENYEKTILIFRSIKNLMSGVLPIRALEGPIGIAKFSGEMARRSFVDLFNLMAYISLFLGYVNLVPIPALDGGHIFIMLVEGLLRRDLSLRVKERVTQAGVAFLIVLIVVVLYFDIVKNV